MKQRYENKTFYDVGRFRYPVSFLQESVTISPGGSQIPGYSTILQTRAVREAVTRRFNVLGDLSLEAGATLMQSYWYFVIRYRKGFEPRKDMVLQTPDGYYSITATPQLDEPPHYWKMLCVKNDQNINVIPYPPIPDPSSVYRTVFNNIGTLVINWQTDIVPGSTKTYSQVYTDNPRPIVWFYSNGNYIDANNKPALTLSGSVLQTVNFVFGSNQTGYITF